MDSRNDVSKDLVLTHVQVQVSHCLSGEKVTLENVPLRLHNAVKCWAKWEKFPKGWGEIYARAVKKYGGTVDAVQRYVDEGIHLDCP